MTIEIVSVPEQAGAVRRAGPAPAEPVSRSRPWRAVLTRAVLVPLVVLLPLVTLTPGADHRFNVYANGGRYGTHPWALLTSVVESVPTYLALGNFRPIGRLVEWSLDVAAFAFTGLLGIPANIGLRLVSFAAAVLLTLVAVLFAESVTARGRLFAAPPTVITTLLPFAVGAGLVAAGRTSTTVLFGGLYLTTAALVLAVAAWACRARRPGLLVLVAGAALAAFNELAYLAVPLATAAVLLRYRVVLAQTWRETLRGPGIRFVALLWAGFLPVFVPVRVLIAQKCAGGGCYAGSDIALSGAVHALPSRLIAWLPPLMWPRATEGTAFHPFAAVPLLAFVALAVLAWRTPKPALPDRRQALGIAGIALVALVLGATLAALNADVQTLAAQGRLGQGWRESGLTTVAGGLLVLAMVRRRALAPVLVVLVVAGMLGAAANKDFRDASAAGQFPYLHDRIALEVADFDPTPAGNIRRCALRDAFRRTSIANHHGVNAPELERFDVSLDRATRQIAGRPFCRGAAK